jgi:hypothetical protein
MSVYGGGFLPSPAASVAMAEAMAVASVLVDGVEPTKRFWFSVALPYEGTVGWFQYLHYRFPKACGWAPYAVPDQFFPFLDPSRWEAYDDGADAVAGLAELVVAHAPTVRSQMRRLALGGALVLLDADAQGLEALFEAVVRVPEPPALVALNYLGAEAGSVVVAPVARRVPRPTAAVLPRAYWQSLLPAEYAPVDVQVAPTVVAREPEEPTPLTTVP